MFTVIAALAFAVILALVYSVVAERFDAAGINRRQFDAWVAIGAFGCWLALAGGDLTARREIAKLRSDADAPQARPTAVDRRIVPALRTPSSAEPGEPVAEGVLVRLPEENPEALEGESAPDGAASAVQDERRPAAGAEAVVAESGRPADTVGATAPEVVSSGDTSSIGASEATTAPQAPVRPIVVIVTPTPSPTRPMPVYTPVLPTPVAPTPELGVLPTATPHCGSPDAIDFSVRIEQAEAERGPDGLKVRYRARIENRSPFPITLADISITAQNSAAGSEHYGHALRPDIALAAHDRVSIEGSIPLTKSPSPFGRTELCFAMVGETCGTRAPYTMLRRCSVVGGF